jgi:hypothetical protein
VYKKQEYYRIVGLCEGKVMKGRPIENTVV